MKVKDLFCGMEVETETAAATLEYHDELYYFCDSACKQMFKLDPEKYIQLAEEK
ncbi:MAG: YHS domain-containing protein [Chloroflexi bacterium]|nr:YHS domain-containing protein [Chloroflexota bacterium]